MTGRPLQDLGADELLAALRAREAAPGAGPLAKSAGALARFADHELAEALNARQKVVYGVDDRRDAHEIAEAVVREQARSVAAVVDVGDLVDDGNGHLTLRSVRFADSHGLCAGERFREQPTAAFCTAFLVGPDLVATAGHCVDRNRLPRLRLVFGFHMLDDATARLAFSPGDVYRARGIVAEQHEPQGSDFALLRLDRAAADRPVLAVRRQGRVPDGSPLYVMGHPSGLPLKHAGGAVVRDNRPATHFVANLDTYGGNSGSPVFHAQTRLVEGILVRGDTDFVTVGRCRVSTVCPTTGCRGEDVTRITQLAAHLPPAP